MGKLWGFYFFDGSHEFVRDGGMGADWVREFAIRNWNVSDIWQVSCGNYIRKGHEFFCTSN